MRKRVVVSGMGCISPVGNSVEESWTSIKNGKTGAGFITAFDASEQVCQVAAEVKGFDAGEYFGRKVARRMDRYTQFALAAANEAFENSGLEITNENRTRIGAVIGTGVGGMSTVVENLNVMNDRGPARVSPFMVPMMLPDSAGGMLAIEYGIQGPNMAVITACATGTNAIGEAAEVIRSGRADVMFAGASEASIIPLAMAGMGRMTALTTRNDDPEGASRPFDMARDGFLMGEGAAVLVLESLENAQNRGSNIIAEVSGYGCTNDAFHISAPSENGVGAANCMQVALDDAGLSSSDIGYINAHGTSTPLNDKNETKAIKTVFNSHAMSTPISSTKSMTGHLLGASGALEAVFCIKAIQDETLPPTINYDNPDPDCDLDYVPNQARASKFDHAMSNSFGFGGHNAAIILSRHN